MPYDDDTARTVDLTEAAVVLGVSPSVVARLLDTGALPWVPTRDVRVRRVMLDDLERHRDERYALRMRLAEQARVLREPVNRVELPV